MSQALLGQTLQILIICKKPEIRDFLVQSIQQLGHTVVATIVTTKADKVVDECRKLPVGPQLVLCDITTASLLDRIYNVFKEKNALVPFVGIAVHPNHEDVLNCADRYFFLACYYHEVLTEKQLALAILVAVKQFARLVEYARAKEQAEQQLAERKAIEKAKGQLMIFRHLSEDEAHHLLQQLAARHHKTLYQQALLTLAASEHISLPKK